MAFIALTAFGLPLATSSINARNAAGSSFTKLAIASELIALDRVATACRSAFTNDFVSRII
ncbi:MAG TPA: hypothetical protein PKA55_16780 [Rhodoblastus sp.]|nr:hypothetical protein [Rhodoblastus sp.]